MESKIKKETKKQSQKIKYDVISDGNDLQYIFWWKKV